MLSAMKTLEYVRAINIAEDSTLHLYVYKPNTKLAAALSTPAASTSIALPSCHTVDALQRLIAALDDAAKEQNYYM